MESNRIRNCVAAGCVFIVLLGVNELFGFEITKFYEGFKPGDHHLEIRDLGFEYADQIAADESAITSLVETPSGDIYGGTTGRACHLFVFRPFYEPGKLERQSNKVKHLGRISGQESIHHSLVIDPNGVIYFGTGLNEIDQPPISEPPQGVDGIVKGLWSDTKKRYDKYEGGHLYKYDIANEKRTWIKNDDECAAKDLGIAVPHNGIYALTINNQRKEIYGLTYPDGHFFVYDINSGKFADIGAVYEKKIYAGPDNRTLRNISRDLVRDDNGFVYGSADDAAMFRYDPEKKKIEKLAVKIPFLYFTAVEVFAKDVGGVIYGGTSEGYLFRFEPARMKVTNLGKPYAQRRIRALTVGKNGVIYGIGGQRDNHCRMFTYNVAESEFDDLGLMRVIREPYYSWSGVQFDAMLTGRDGIIYAGESERRSHLFLYYP
jgi:hypothetical protein